MLVDEKKCIIIIFFRNWHHCYYTYCYILFQFKKHGCRVGWRSKYNNFCLQKYTTLYNLFKKLTNGSSLVLCKHCKPNYYYSSFWWLPICCYMNNNIIILLHWLLLLMRMGMLFSLNIFILFNFFFFRIHYRNNYNIVKKCNIRFKPNSILFRLT